MYNVSFYFMKSSLYFVIFTNTAAETFIIKDRTFEKQRKCSLSASLTKARAGPPLLHNQKFFITSNVQPAPSEMVNIIKCSGGEVGLVSCDPCCRLLTTITTCRYWIACHWLVAILFP